MSAIKFVPHVVSIPLKLWNNDTYDIYNYALSIAFEKSDHDVINDLLNRMNKGVPNSITTNMLVC